MILSNKYHWNFCSLGGVTRVRISSGEDIAHLDELDPKLWTVLSCPVDGLYFDRKTLEILDSDKDGRIRIDEVVDAAKWVSSLLSDRDLLLKGSDSLPLSAINTESEAGKALHCSAKRILANLGKGESSDITLAEASDSVKIFAGTKFNGDGVITPASAEENPAAKEAVEKTIALIGSKLDRSGEPGVDEALVNDFYAALADYVAWQEALTPEILPYGDNTAAALAAVEAVSDKVADYFMRCSLVSFDADAKSALDVPVDKLSAISGANLNAEIEQISLYPLARPEADGILHLDALNPAWKAAFAKLKSLVPEADKKTLDADEWNAIVSKFAAYKSWLASKRGGAVESLGLDAVRALLQAGAKDEVLAFIEKDKAVASEAEGIDVVDKFMHLYRYFYEFLNNYVIFGSFYNLKERAVFEAGELYIDQRSIKLCIEVSDMAKQTEGASLSGMYIIYCDCVSKALGKKKTIAAVLTDGDVDALRVGMNAVFYDRDGVDYDAVVTKIIDNPVSVRQAFWSPYKKLARSITDRINKRAAEKEKAVDSGLAKVANEAKLPTADAAKTASAAAPAGSFDIAKFAGIFAALGMAVGFIGSALAALVKPWYTGLIVIAVLMVCISGPSMFLAWSKLRKRNLGPVLNANGWAVNSKVIVNILFGVTLTSLAKYPKLAALEDPYAPKKNPWPKVIAGFVVLVGIFLALFFTDNLKWMGIHRHNAPEAVEQVVECPEQSAE